MVDRKRRKSTAERFLPMTPPPPDAERTVGRGRGVALPEGASILVMKRGGVGDFVLLTPALRALRQRYPRARIDALVSSRIAERFLAACGLVDALFVMDRRLFESSPGEPLASRLAPLLRLGREFRSRRYDAVLCFNHLLLGADLSLFSALIRITGATHRIGLDCGTTGSFLSIGVPDAGFGARHEAEYPMALVEAIDATVEDPQPFVPLDASLRRRARALVADGSGRGASAPIIGMHPGCHQAFPARRWPAESFARLADRLFAEFGGRLLLLGGPEEAGLRLRVWAAMRSAMPCIATPESDDLMLTAALLEQCHLFVANDSGPMHIAAAVGTPTVGVFGLTNPEAWRPFMPAYPDRARAIFRDLPCRPCNYVGLHGGDGLGCDSRECLTGLGVERVAAAARDLLSRALGEAAHR